MEVSDADFVKKCLTGMFDIIKARFPKAEIIVKYMIISGCCAKDIFGYVWYLSKVKGMDIKMKIVKAGYEILTPISQGGIQELQHIEKIARVCYKSENLITEDGESAKKMVKMLINRDHTAMIEHSMLSVKFIVDRGVSHEIVRHRISSFAQESTRYCNYAKDKFHNEITVIRPNFFLDETSKAYQQWEDAMRSAEKSYFSLMEAGATPQEARSVLPNSTKTEITMTANYREWRNFFKLRTDKAAHPQMREVAVPLLKELQEKLPIVFDDIIVEE